MSRISRIIALTLALLLAFSAAGEGMLIDESRIDDYVVNYKTATVELGAFTRTGQTSVAMYYPTSVNVSYEGPTARFVEYFVHRGNEVKAGDKLATFMVASDEVELAKIRLSLKRAQENRENGLKEKDDAIEELKNAPDAQTEIGLLRIRKAEIEREKFDFESLQSVESLENSLSSLEVSFGLQTVYAPIDGTVDNLITFRSNEEISPGTYLMRIYDSTDVLFHLEDNAGIFRFNMPVTLGVGNARDRMELAGRVVACYNALPEKASGKDVYIRVDEYDPIGMKSVVRPTIAYTQVYVGSVCLVNKDALSYYGGRYYAYILSPDGMVSKRFVNFATSSNVSGAWVLDGLQPGDVLIMD